MWQMSADSCGCTTVTDAPALHNVQALCCVDCDEMRVIAALAMSYNDAFVSDHQTFQQILLQSQNWSRDTLCRHLVIGPSHILQQSARSAHEAVRC